MECFDKLSLGPSKHFREATKKAHESQRTEWLGAPGTDRRKD
ncbi:hypothetical protein SNOG_05405 [Parastagonospora nodorum SN15]|uniref:Uncharacterized protein n=1 Tax=Phaeosphaeria nodorum (strain SN15 / ATCC MYA-4574 / FGSC 10173) TaxID=321614 RepID=Q0US59_PHANO|nr:hypothetical protein SNOG_05405 [Parastagonospora nodorum SN15]EAT87796.1 hypothetical protein SNOG_05405 [Parastagonospora nodorum SN15]